MALVKLGNGAIIPNMSAIALSLGLTNTTALTATGHKAAFVGRMWNKDGANKTLVGIGLCFGAITKAGGSGLTISQQGVDAANGPVYQPDGVQAQTWAVANGNASFASTTWLNTSDNAGQAVTFNQLMSIVVEYDGSGRQGADSVTIRGITSNAAGTWGVSGTVMYNNTSWAAQSVIPNLVLKFSDGTYGTLEGAIPCSAFSSLAFNTSTVAQDEAGLEFTVPGPLSVDGAWATINHITGADFDLVLYSGTTALKTISNDGNAIHGTGSPRFDPVPFVPESLTAAVTYRFVVKPTTTTSVSLYYIDLNLAAHRQALPGWWGESGAWVTRVDAGAWAAATTTRVPLMGLRVSHIDDGAGGGGGGGLLKVGGMTGGMSRTA